MARQRDKNDVRIPFGVAQYKLAKAHMIEFTYLKWNMTPKGDTKMASGPGNGAPTPPEGGPVKEGAPASEMGQPASEESLVNYAALYEAAQQESGAKTPAAENEIPETDTATTQAQPMEVGSEQRQQEVQDEPERNETLGNDINRRVIDVQRAAGWDVGPDWYDKYVSQVAGNGATEEQMFAAFMQAFDAHFPAGQDGHRHADDETRALGATPIGAEAKTEEPAQSVHEDSDGKVLSFPQRPESPQGLDKAA